MTRIDWNGCVGHPPPTRGKPGMERLLFAGDAHLRPTSVSILDKLIMELGSGEARGGAEVLALPSFS